MAAMSNNNSTRNFIPMQNKYDRVVLLVDMDCFYCQVEEKLNPEYKGMPLAVVQYNAWRGGGIIAVNYAARAQGVTRHMRGDEAKEQCPDIILAKVPNVREKADLSKYRDAGKEVANVLQRYTQLLERASIDEAYLDITDSVNKRLEELSTGLFVLQPQELINTYAVGYANIGEYVNTITTRCANPYKDDNDFMRAHDHNDLPAVRQSDLRLLIGASIAGEIRAAVKSVTSYECSAGIAHNKILAKLACGMNKPNKQTILPLNQIPELFETLAIGKIKGLGGKFGEDVCERLKIKYLGQLLKFTEAELQQKFDEKNGSFLYYISRGIDLEAVTPRFYSKSIGCCKKFPGRNNITGVKTLQHWLNELAGEINERLDKDLIENNRKAKQMVVSFIQEIDGNEISSSRSAPLNNSEQEALTKHALDVIKANTRTFFKPGSDSALNNPIKFLGISVGKFETISNGQTKLQEMFANQVAKKRKISDDDDTSKNLKLQEALEPASTTENSKESNVEKSRNFMESYLLQADKKHGNEPITKPEEVKRRNSQDITNFFAKKPQDVNTNPIFDEIPEQSDTNVSPQSEQNTTSKSDPSKSFFYNKFKQKIEEPVEPTKSEIPKNVKEIENIPIDIISESIVKPSLKQPDPSKSFFLKILKEQKSKAIQNQKPNASVPFNSNSVDDATKAEFEIQMLAADLQEIETSNKKVDELCQEILNSAENEKCISNTTIVSEKRKPLAAANSSAINQATEIDYRSSYAEYALPSINADLLKYIKCEKCGAKILDDPVALQTHQDHHFAQQLSQQQRTEFRNEIQSKISATTTETATKKSPNSNANKKQSRKVKPSSTKTTTIKADITKFLKAKPALPEITLSTEPSTSSAAAAEAAALEPTELCDKCHVFIKISEKTEHIDYHVAKELQRELNQQQVRTVSRIQKPSSGNKKQLNANSSITQFFTPKS